jgi:hypothetical protein
MISPPQGAVRQLPAVDVEWHRNRAARDGPTTVKVLLSPIGHVAIFLRLHSISVFSQLPLSSEHPAPGDPMLLLRCLGARNGHARAIPRIRTELK